MEFIGGFIRILCRKFGLLIALYLICASANFAAAEDLGKIDLSYIEVTEDSKKPIIKEITLPSGVVSSIYFNLNLRVYYPSKISEMRIEIVPPKGKSFVLTSKSLKIKDDGTYSPIRSFYKKYEYKLRTPIEAQGKWKIKLYESKNDKRVSDLLYEQISEITFRQLKAPPPKVTSSIKSPAKQSPIPIQVDFFQKATGFTASDLIVNGADISNFKGSGAKYQFSLIPRGDGKITVDLPKNVVKLLTGAGNSAATQFSILYDAEAPKAKFIPIKNNRTNQQTVTIEVEFSEPVKGLGLLGISTASTGSITNIRYTDKDSDGYSKGFAFDFKANSEKLLTVIINKNAVKDKTGKYNNKASYNFHYDHRAPTVILSSSVTAPTSQSYISINATFSENVMGFDKNDVNVSGAIIKDVTGSGKDYVINLFANKNGKITVSIPKAVLQDTAGNDSIASHEWKILREKSRSKVKFSSQVNELTKNSSIPIEVSFDFPTTDFDINDLNITNGTASEMKGSGKNYSFKLSPLKDGKVTVNIADSAVKDEAGDGNLPAVWSAAYDGTAPAVAEVLAATGVVNEDMIPVGIRLTEPVSGFGPEALELHGAKIGPIKHENGIYRFTLTPDGPGQISIAIKPGQIKDLAGNAMPATRIYVVNYDNIAPTAQISSPETSPTKATKIPLRVTFLAGKTPEIVTGFTASDLILTGATVAEFTPAQDGYDIILTPKDNATEITIAIPAAVATDAAGNPNRAAAPLRITRDVTNPDVTITATIPNGTATNKAPIPIKITFSEPVTKFDKDDLQLKNATLQSFDGSGKDYNAVITPLAEGEVVVNIKAQVAEDPAGNASRAAAPFTLIYDQTAPTIAEISRSGTGTAPRIPMQMIFSEDVQGLTASDLTVTNATISGLTGSGGRYSFDLTPTRDGEITVSIPAGAVHDAAGNLLSAEGKFTATHDTTGPKLQITPASGLTGNQSPIRVELQFNEPVQGFSPKALRLSNARVTSSSGQDALYHLELTPEGDGQIRLELPANAVQDGAGNGNLPAVWSAAYDGTAPAVAEVLAATGVVNGDMIPVGIRLTEPVSGFGHEALELHGAKIGPIKHENGIYRFTLTPDGPGQISIAIKPGQIKDLAGNAMPATRIYAVNYDNIAPTAQISSPETSPTKATKIPLRVTFLAGKTPEIVTGFTASDLILTGATVAEFTPAQDGYDIILTPKDNATEITIAIPAAVATDAAGNPNRAAAPLRITRDVTNPEVTITATIPNGTATNKVPIPIKITFSEPVTKFDKDDLELKNATLQSFDGSGKNYNAVITPLAEGEVVVNIKAQVAEDPAGNASRAAAPFTLIYDQTAPTITEISRSGTGTAPRIPMQMIFSEDVQGLTASDLTVTNATISGLTGNGGRYRFDLTPTRDGEITVSIPAGAVHDAAGNLLSAEGKFTATHDTTGPKLQITPASGLTVNQSPIRVELQFNEPVQGFSPKALRLSNARVTSSSGQDALYHLELTPESDGQIRLELPANAVKDGAGNGNLPAVWSAVYDGTAPAVAEVLAATGVVNGDRIPVGIRLTEPVSGFDPEALELHGAKIGPIKHEDGIYRFTLTPDGPGQISIAIKPGQIKDLAGNAMPATRIYAVNYDNIAPTAQISSPETSPTKATKIPLRVTFLAGKIPEIVTGFTASDLILTGATVAEFTPAQDGYDIILTPKDNATEITIAIPAAVATDAAGNPNRAAAPLRITRDVTNPDITITATIPNGTATNKAPIPVKITFSEPVTKFDKDDLQLKNATLQSFDGSGKDYNAVITPLAEGEVVVNIKAQVAEDPAGNASRAAAPFTLIYDQTAPTIAEISRSGTGTAPRIPMQMIFSEDVQGLTASDLTVTNATISGLTGSGGRYSFDLTPTRDGEITVNIPAGAVHDAAGNLLSAEGTFTATHDTTGPKLQITPASGLTGNQSPIRVELQFNEPVQGFSPKALRLSNARVTSSSGQDALYRLELTPESDGQIRLELPANAVKDGAGNGNLPAVWSAAYDGTAPAVAEVLAATGVVNGDMIPVGIRLTEPVSGFGPEALELHGAKIGPIKHENGIYRFTLTPDGPGQISIAIRPGQIKDLAGNAMPATRIYAVNYDNIAPTAQISSPETSPTKATRIPLRVTFLAGKTPEIVTGFTASDLILTGATVAEFIPAQDGYDIILTPKDNATEITIAIPAAVATDAAGNPNRAAAPLRITRDVTNPEVTITATIPNGTATNKAPIPVKITFSEPVTKFDKDDLELKNASAKPASAQILDIEGKYYRFDVFPDNDGEVTVSISPKFLESINRFATKSQDKNLPEFKFIYDNKIPSAWFDMSKQRENTEFNIMMTLHFDEVVKNVSKEFLNISGAKLKSFEGEGALYHFELEAENYGEIKIDLNKDKITDIVGNPLGKVQPHTVTLEEDAPEVTITLTEKHDNESTIYQIDVIFSETVTDFEPDDLVVSGAQIVEFSGGGKKYQAKLMAHSEEAVTVDLPADRVSDLQNDGNLAAKQLAIRVGHEKLTVTLTGTSDFPGNVYIVKVKFSGPVTDLKASDFKVINANIEGLDGTGADYTLRLRSQQFTHSIKLPAGAVRSEKGITNEESNLLTAGADGNRPVPTIIGLPEYFEEERGYDLAFQFSEPVIGFTADDIVITNGTASDFSGHSQYYHALITAGSAEYITLSIPDAAARDKSGENSIALTARVKIEPKIESAKIAAKAITEFSQTRIENLLRGQPDLVGLLRNRRRYKFTAELRGYDEHLNFVIDPEKNPLWLRVDAARSKGEDNQDTVYVHSVAGTQIMLNERLMFGTMLQMDRSVMTSSDNVAIRGNGWLAGPFFVSEMENHPIYQYGSLFYGKSTNEVSPLGTFTDQFKGKRLLATYGMEGDYTLGSLRISPNVTFSQSHESFDTYTDSLSNEVPAQSLSVAELNMGVNFEAPIWEKNDKWRHSAEISGIWSHRSGTGAARDYLSETAQKQIRIAGGSSMTMGRI